VPKGKTLELLPVKNVSSADDVMHVDGGASFLLGMMVNTAEANFSKLFGVSIGLKRYNTKCEVKP